MTYDYNKSWTELLAVAMSEAGDSGPVIHCTLSADEMAVKFDTGHGGEQGQPFTVWTERRVYFPLCYDGAEWVGSAPRDPCDEALRHQGG